MINDAGVEKRIWEAETMQSIPEYIADFGLSKKGPWKCLKSF